MFACELTGCVSSASGYHGDYCIVESRYSRHRGRPYFKLSMWKKVNKVRGCLYVTLCWYRGAAIAIISYIRNQLRGCQCACCNSGPHNEFLGLHREHSLDVRLFRLRSNVTSSIKPEVHNVAQRRRRRTEPRPQGISTQNFVMIRPAVPEICSRTDRQTDTHTYTQTDRRLDYNTQQSYRGEVIL